MKIYIGSRKVGMEANLHQLYPKKVMGVIKMVYLKIKKLFLHLCISIPVTHLIRNWFQKSICNVFKSTISNFQRVNVNPRDLRLYSTHDRPHTKRIAATVTW